MEMEYKTNTDLLIMINKMQESIDYLEEKAGIKQISPMRVELHTEKLRCFTHKCKKLTNKLFMKEYETNCENIPILYFCSDCYYAMEKIKKCSECGNQYK